MTTKTDKKEKQYLGLFRGEQMYGNQPTADCLNELSQAEENLTKRLLHAEREILRLEYQPKTFWQLFFKRKIYYFLTWFSDRGVPLDWIRYSKYFDEMRYRDW